MFFISLASAAGVAMIRVPPPPPLPEVHIYDNGTTVHPLKRTVAPGGFEINTVYLNPDGPKGFATSKQTHEVPHVVYALFIL